MSAMRDMNVSEYEIERRQGHYRKSAQLDLMGLIFSLGFILGAMGGAALALMVMS